MARQPIGETGASLTKSANLVIRNFYVSKMIGDIICFGCTCLWNLMLNEVLQRVTTYPGTWQVVTTLGACCNTNDWPSVCS